MSDLTGITGFANQDQLFVYMEEVRTTYKEVQDEENTGDENQDSPAIGLPLSALALASTFLAYHVKKKKE